MIYAAKHIHERKWREMTTELRLRIKLHKLIVLVFWTGGNQENCQAILEPLLILSLVLEHLHSFVSFLLRLCLFSFAPPLRSISTMEFRDKLVPTHLSIIISIYFRTTLLMSTNIAFSPYFHPWLSVSSLTVYGRARNDESKFSRLKFLEKLSITHEIKFC